MGWRLCLLSAMVALWCGSVTLAQDEACECQVYYQCDQANTVTSSKCETPEVCCKSSGPSTPSIATGKPPPKPRDQPSGSCTCVPAKQCPEVSGAGQLNVRINKVCKTNEVCCPNKGNSGTGGDNSNNGGSGGNPDVTPNTNGDLPFDESDNICGVRRAQNEQFTSNRISGGLGEKTETFFGEYPWMLAILFNRENADGTITESVFQCGASLIQPNVVLTAAHCVHKIAVSSIRVRGGEWDTRTETENQKEPFPYEERTVSQVYIHKDFDPDTVYNDIAVLILDFPFPIKNHIGFVCTVNFIGEYDPNDCIVTGWGKDKFGKEGTFQSTLRKVNLKVVERDQCEQSLRKTRLGSYFQLHESFMCAQGDLNQDACKGDGGGPLICKIKSEKNRYTQVGIVAWGIGCGNENPGVYVDVHKFKKWILGNSHGQTIDVRIRNKD